MDLSLRGSQINLAARYKPKPTSVKYPVVQRPCSANVHRYRRSSPFLRRPMSADEKLARSLRNCVKFSEQVLSEEQLWKSKKFMSASSSSLFKLLLEEPINRSCCHQDSESLSDSSLGQKICEAATKQTKFTELSETDSNMDDEDNQSNQDEVKNDLGSKMRTNHKVETSNNRSLLNNKSPHIDVTTSNPKQYPFYESMTLKTNNLRCNSTDFWHDSKPDLPGRVSFGKTDTSEVDLNYEQGNSSNDISTSTKKCVHFEMSGGERPDTIKGHHEGSSSTIDAPTPASNIQHENQSNKCFCPFTCNSSGYITYSENESNTPDIHEAKSETISNSVIDQYTNEIDDEGKKIQLELKMLEKNAKSTPETDCVINNYRQLANQIFEDIQADLSLSTEKSTSNSDEGQNDLSQSRKTKNNSLSDEKSSNSTDSSKSNQFDISHLRDFQESSSAVIKNYLRATEKQSSNFRKTKQNNLNANKTDENGLKIRRAKSANTAGNAKSAMKKVPTFASLRQDSNLDEFQIEKVDSWMSLHDEDIYRDSPEMQFSNKNNAKTRSILMRKENIESIKSEESSQEDSTYEEIVSVIKEIEEDKRKESTAARVDVHLKLQPSSTPESDFPTTPKTERNHRDQSPDKLKDILHYLDNVESSCDKTIMETRRSIPESSRSEIEFAIEPDIAEDVPKIADLLMLPNHQLARRVVALSLRANELSNGIQLSKQHVVHVRLERQKAIRQEKANTMNRLKEQKKHFECTITRHQGFIEQLLKDKGSLCEKVATLTRRIESQNQAWEHKMQTEIARTKETALAGEKVRREKWIRENTKKIKELTVKGLEIEINKMSCEHQKEVTELKRQHQQSLLDAVAEEREKYEQLEKSIRESCAQDRESSIAKERNAIRERFEKQIREEQKSFDEQKSKLLEEFAIERERMSTEIRQKDLEMENKKQEIIKEKEIALEQVCSEFRDKFQKQDHKYQTRINTIEKQFESDFLIWKREFENVCKLREVENENAIRQHYRSERDRQIDAIVTKMDTETQRCQEDYEIKLSRLKEKYDCELHEVENAEKSLKEKFNESRNRLAESEARLQNIQAESKQIKMELSHSKKMCDNLLEEKELMKENARREVQQEIATIQTERDNEIQKIYHRVQQAIEKKDTAMELLQKENSSLRERCIKLEAVIRQQRKDYCIK